MLMTVIRLAQRGWGSPFQVQQILSTLQWYDLIFRAKLSVYQHICGFTNGGQDKRGKNIPSRVLGELVLSALLAIFWSADLRRSLLPLICCSDASSSLGFCGSILKTSDDVVQKLARLALKDDAFAVLDNAARARDYHKRIGSLHGIGVSCDASRDAFTHVFSVRQTRDDHINRLEGEALLLMLRWILRSSRRHASQVVILLESAVLLGGAAKGRSSSRLNTILRRAAALQLLGDLLVYWVLVPSAENPSDIPSRGRWR